MGTLIVLALAFIVVIGVITHIAHRIDEWDGWER